MEITLYLQKFYFLMTNVTLIVLKYELWNLPKWWVSDIFYLKHYYLMSVDIRIYIWFSTDEVIIIIFPYLFVLTFFNSNCVPQKIKCNNNPQNNNEGKDL